MGTTLATLSPPPGARRKRKRVGRGPGSGNGTTAGRGSKGQRSRSGIGGLARGFEGGQMPLQRRLPKVGFRTAISRATAEVRLSELAAVTTGVIDLAALQAANVLSRSIVRAKVIASGKIDKAVRVRGLGVTKGARAAIEAAGGSVED
jgi:large subunit ribosomal protein L15